MIFFSSACDMEWSPLSLVNKLSLFKSFLTEQKFISVHLEFFLKTDVHQRARCFPIIDYTYECNRGAAVTKFKINKIKHLKRNKKYFTNLTNWICSVSFKVLILNSLNLDRWKVNLLMSRVQIKRTIWKRVRPEIG